MLNRVGRELVQDQSEITQAFRKKCISVQKLMAGVDVDAGGKPVAEHACDGASDIKEQNLVVDPHVVGQPKSGNAADDQGAHVEAAGVVVLRVLRVLSVVRQNGQESENYTVQ